ncbi:MAG TPA: hypothetical protein DEF45_08350 [Rhodopirellula sp.]|nr:MAG: hypothetical protein CBD74_07180 [Saprospirales bacterium TMED214]HBV63016.1 hypothetical protein [Rhodopirellula sp.]
MPRPHKLLTPAIIEYSTRCTKEEKSAIVAYCCHLAFSDKTIRRLEVEFVEAIADQMQVGARELQEMAGKARRRRLKIKTPASRAARTLLFHLAMRTAMADTEAGVRERSSIEHLAEKLRISPEVLNRELNKLQQKRMLPSGKSPSLSARSENKADKPEASVIESLSQNMVAETLRATLTSAEVPSVPREPAELVYTLTSDGDAEVELIGSGFRLPAGEKFSVIIAGKHLCEIVGPLSQHTQTIKVKQPTSPQEFTTGASVVIQRQDAPLLSGTLEPNGW